jgi:site-specific DNA-cytosine methylase
MAAPTVMPRCHTIPVIDLFASPGGPGEGFSAYRATNGSFQFRIALSIEKDLSAAWFAKVNGRSPTVRGAARLQAFPAKDLLRRA